MFSTVYAWRLLEEIEAAKHFVVAFERLAFFCLRGKHCDTLLFICKNVNSFLTTENFSYLQQRSSKVHFVFFAFNFSLRFDLVIFASKRNKAKWNSSIFFRFFRFFSLFFAFCRSLSLFSLFSLNFGFTSIFPLNFRLFYLRFRFSFLVFRIEVNHVKSGFFFASKRNEIFASISNFASEAKVRAHPNGDSCSSRPCTFSPSPTWQNLPYVCFITKNCTQTYPHGSSIYFYCERS